MPAWNLSWHHFKTSFDLSFGKAARHVTKMTSGQSWPVITWCTVLKIQTQISTATSDVTFVMAGKWQIVTSLVLSLSESGDGQSPPMWHCLCLLWPPTKQLTQLLWCVLRLPHNTMQKILSIEVVQNKISPRHIFHFFPHCWENLVYTSISLQWEF